MVSIAGSSKNNEKHQKKYTSETNLLRLDICKLWRFRSIAANVGHSGSHVGSGQMKIKNRFR